MYCPQCRFFSVGYYYCNRYKDLPSAYWTICDTGRRGSTKTNKYKWLVTMCPLIINHYRFRPVVYLTNQIPGSHPDFSNQRFMPIRHHLHQVILDIGNQGCAFTIGCKRSTFSSPIYYKKLLKQLSLKATIFDLSVGTTKVELCENYRKIEPYFAQDLVTIVNNENSWRRRGVDAN